MTTEITPTRAIVLILLGVFFISINDMLIKSLSSSYALHQIVLIRSMIGLVVLAPFLIWEGGVSLLRTDQPFAHAARALLLVMANIFFFGALAVLPLAAATSLFFVAPLFITALAVPVLGETVGPHRLAALIVGFIGVAIIVLPDANWQGVSTGALSLPILAAVCYAGTNVLTRKLGARAQASAMAIYIQAAFVLMSALVWIAVGDGRFADTFDSPTMEFLLRAWVWPEVEDYWKIGVIGVMTGGIGFCLSQAYRLGAPATIASYEYVALVLAIFWGWLIFGEVLSGTMLVGIVFIAGAGLYVFDRERRRDAVSR